MKHLPTVLIVDDSRVIRHAIAGFLADYPVVTVEAGDGEAALEAYARYRPALVTLDITMPEMDGLAVLSELKAVDPDLQVMVITALKDEQTRRKALALGADDFLTKPVTAHQVRDSFESLTGKIGMVQG
ncbi:MAG: response regulator [Calditrichaeota bacterium]|nr:response regulator [Calditrichota bacterium]HQU70812.1 response regulator [Calditrichia bacterium]